jgi:hypothetical protein
MKGFRSKVFALIIAILTFCGSLATQIPVYAITIEANVVPVGFKDESLDFLNSLIEESENHQQENMRSFSISSSTAALKADVVFVIDSTGSMASYIANVKNNISVLAKSLSDKGITLRIGVVEYRDIAVDGLNSTVIHKSSYSPWMSLSNFVSTPTNVSVNGGGDNPETPIDALGYLVDGSSMLWSSDSYKFAFVLTDDSYKINNSHGYASLSAISDMLADQGIYTSVITTTSNYTTYSPLTSATGGILTNINSSNFSSVLEELADSLMGVTQRSRKAIYVLPGYLGSELYDSTSSAAKILWPDVHYVPIFDWLQREHEQGKKRSDPHQTRTREKEVRPPSEKKICNP